jgi:hypothetical protein
MIPISFWWNSRDRSASIKLDGLVSSEWKSGRMTTKILGIPIFFSLTKKTIRFSRIPPIRWIYLRGFFSFLSKGKLKKLEGTLSFSDPMVNGVVYGWMSAVQAGKPDRKIAVTVNFSGENWLRGKFTVSLKTLIHHFKSWMYPLIREVRGKKVSQGGERSWKRLI